MHFTDVCFIIFQYVDKPNFKMLPPKLLSRKQLNKVSQTPLVGSLMHLWQPRNIRNVISGLSDLGPDQMQTSSVKLTVYLAENPHTYDYSG